MPVCFLLLSASANAQQSKDNTILSVEKNKEDNTPIAITFTQNTNWNPTQAQEIFKQYLGVDGVNTQMKRLYSTTTKKKITSDRYTEYFKGIKVSFGGFTLMSKDNRVSFITGNYYRFNNATSAVPAITAGTAFSKALSFVGAEKYMWQDAGEEARIKTMYHNPDTSFLPKGQLEWIEDINSGSADRKLHLAWAFNIYATQPLSRQMVYIDATTGKVLFSNSLLKHTAASGPQGSSRLSW